MTLANLKIRLEIEKKAENSEAIKIIETKIARKMLHPKYAHLDSPFYVGEIEKPKTKSKEKKKDGS